MIKIIKSTRELFYYYVSHLHCNINCYLRETAISLLRLFQVLTEPVCSVPC